MLKIIKKILDILLIIIIVLLVSFVILRYTKKIEIYEVETGSMESTIHAGDYILIFDTDNYEKGDIVTYKFKNGYITHRIVEINDSSVITKGDANNVNDDPIKIDSIVGEVIYIGGILNFLINFKYAIASGLLGLYLISYYFEKSKKKEE